MTIQSPIEHTMRTPIETVRALQALKEKQTQDHTRPGEGHPTEPGGPVNWHAMNDDEYEETWSALCDFLAWALPHWNFTTDQVPHQCWWQHPDIVEEFTAWWGLWQACVRNPAAGIAEQTSFQERTFALKQRLDHTYRGRCRQSHQPSATLEIALPDLQQGQAIPIPER